MSSSHFPILASIGAAAETIYLILPPKLSYISLNTFFLISTPTTFSAFVRCIIEFTRFSFLLFWIFALIFLYRFSINSGTVNKEVGFVSCKLETIYFSPWQTEIEAPTANGNKNPIVDSYVWCNGNIDINLSSEVRFTYARTSFIFSAKFLLHSITPFEFEVVPDVNISTLNSSGSTLIFINELSPCSTICFPCSIK